MKQCLINALSIFTICITNIFFPYISIYAAILQMKGGQKVEGEYIGGSKNEVHIVVGSQILKFKVKEIDAIIFNTSANLSFQDSPKDDFSKATKEVLRVIKGLAAVTEAGINYKEYSPRVLDAKVKINEFLEEYKDFNSEFNQHISDALGYYNAAASAWNAKITGANSACFDVAANPYIYKCQTLNKEMKKWIDESKKEDSLNMVDEIYIGIYAGSSLGISALWDCAKSEINEAEALLKK